MFFSLIFCSFLVILASKMKGLGGDFSMKFWFLRENADIVKIMVFPREKIYIFQSLGFQKSIKNREKIDAKCDVKNDGQKMTPKARKNQFLKPFWPPQTLVFWDFGYKNEDGFLQHKNEQKRQQTDLPNPPQS